MNYELAKKLKEAGFANDIDIPGTQTSRGSKTLWLYGPKGVPSDEMVYVPTLSELIEACGEKFDFLANNRNGVWQASGGEVQDRQGQTPEEAVANLWLALNPHV